MNIEIDTKCVNEIRMLAAELPLAANSGHQGAPIGCAPIAHILWGYVMNYYNEDTEWINRDRFVLSNGHMSSLLYTMLYLTEQGLALDDLKKFRQLGSLTPGHPENYVTKGVEVTTGPLGQGAANAVGMAICAHNLSEKYNTDEFEIFNNYIYATCGDGCMQEGVFCEAASLAGHLGLGRLILLYDDNKITIDGNTELSFTEDIAKKFEAFNWEVKIIKDGNTDFEKIYKEIEECKKNLKQPSLIIVQTLSGFGTKVEGSHKSHGLALKDDDIKNAKIKLGLDPEKKFHISDQVKNFYKDVLQKNKNNYMKWKETFDKYMLKYPEKGQEILKRFKKELPDNWESVLPKYTVNDPPLATRNLSGIALNSINKILPGLIGGSADLTESNCTALKDEKDITKNSFGNKYIRYGIREHGMVAISNGIHAYGGFEPFCGTFLNFYTYAFGALRLSALSNHHVLCIATHDSVELGEDGPTHQPIEVLALLRATPNLNIIRPADGNEVSGAYLCHFKNLKTPTVIALCRNKVPHLKNTSAEGVLKGAYILEDFEKNTKQKVILSGCGSELHLCFEAKNILKSKHNLNVRIVSFPSWTLFKKQTKKYQTSIMMHNDPKIVRFYIEPASTFGFDTYFNTYIGIDQFGCSAPKDQIWNHLGFTADNIVKKVLDCIKIQIKRLPMKTY
ncbi:transketolase [Plasmodium vinckei petteri]|uniref:transketolase n=1 Tax=Plasmodium vinckei petteri TaxID=138298 RepID=W7AED9_PLAVN|nr:transketolase [Plasmodium vinckei petteri]CAD2095371.1 transketolase, putative [Plasmodium vinckei petteri]